MANKEEKMAQEAQFSAQDLIEDGRKYEMAYNGNVTDGAVLLGQSIGVINSLESASDIISTIVKDAEKYIKKTSNFVK